MHWNNGILKPQTLLHFSISRCHANIAMRCHDSRSRQIAPNNPNKQISPRSRRSRSRRSRQSRKLFRSKHHAPFSPMPVRIDTTIIIGAPCRPSRWDWNRARLARRRLACTYPPLRERICSSINKIYVRGVCKGVLLHTVFAHWHALPPANANSAAALRLA